jgi:putative methyltransferase (TIGR04325 family)
LGRPGVQLSGEPAVRDQAEAAPSGLDGNGGHGGCGGGDGRHDVNESGSVDMKPFRSTPIGRGVKRLARYVFSHVAECVRYLSAELRYAPQGWRLIKGWDDQGIADAQQRHWPTLVRNLQGPGPLGVAHFPWHTTREDRADHNVMMSYGYVLALAARKKDAISILDWGGGAGHYCLYSKALLPEVAVQYHCYDVPTLCRVGRTLLPDIHLSDNEAEFVGQQFDLVVSSSSLHYFEDWRAEVRKLAAMTQEFLYLSRLPIVTRAASFVVSHKIYHDGYGEFQSWCINQQELLSCVEECGLDLVREFVYYRKAIVRGASEQTDCRGFLFKAARRPRS